MKGHNLAPPPRYDYDKKRRPQNPADGTLLGKALDFLDDGAEVMGEVFQEVKQAVKDMNSVEVEVIFGLEDKRLGLRVERRPTGLNLRLVSQLNSGSKYSLLRTSESSLMQRHFTSRHHRYY